jgi:hypothetical protein
MHSHVLWFLWLLAAVFAFQAVRLKMLVSMQYRVGSCVKRVAAALLLLLLAAVVQVHGVMATLRSHAACRCQLDACERVHSCLLPAATALALAGFNKTHGHSMCCH